MLEDPYFLLISGRGTVRFVFGGIRKREIDGLRVGQIQTEI